MKTRLLLMMVVALAAAPGASAGKKIVILAGPLDSHPPGTHEYEKSALLLKHCLETAENVEQRPEVEVHFQGWPQDESVLEEADSIVVVSAGSDRREEDHPLLVGERLKVLAPQMGRGCGLVLFHWATFLPLRVQPQAFRWVGGHFDYEGGEAAPDGRRWHSAIETKRWMCRPAGADHPITRGVGPFELQEEFYYRIRFPDDDPRWSPVLKVDGPQGRDAVVAWGLERLDGGRGFGFTGGHYYDNWEVPEYRRLVLNAILWTAKIEVPEGGVRSETRKIPETRGAHLFLKPEPLQPERWPHRSHPVNRERLYDFYGRQAEAFAGREDLAGLVLPEHPGLDGGRHGHWGNQDEETWKDARWNLTEHGSVVSNVFRGANMTIPKAVCVHLGGPRRLSAVFNASTATWDVVWSGGFVTFSDIRHGFMDGAYLEGEVITASRPARPPLDLRYRGFHRAGGRVIFRYESGGRELLDWAEEKDGAFVRTVIPADDPRAAGLTSGGPVRWPQVITTRGETGASHDGWAIDTLTLPFDNPWRTLLFLGGHDFFRNGDAAVCTITGEVWTVSGIDGPLENLRWRRFATGLHQPLGLRIVEDQVHVLGRDQITRLHDVDGNGEADFHECVTQAYVTSPAGHDFVTGLERDAQGRFYFASGKQGLCRVDPATDTVEVLATGLRNPDGLALAPDGRLTTGVQEGDWCPASAVCLISPGEHYGHGGPKDGAEPARPLLYLPRGFDNATGGQVFVEGEGWGLPEGALVGLSYGAALAYQIVPDAQPGMRQALACAIPGEFRSGAHRGRFRPQDGQLYVSGMGGWGTYSPDDGCFQRLRWTGERGPRPAAWEARDNGVLLRFDRPLDPVAAEPRRHFVQMWNYRYGPQYGSPEYSVLWPETPGHDPLVIRSAHVLADGHTLFLEIPELRPAQQVHLRVRPAGEEALDLFATVHQLGPAFAAFPGYQPLAKSGTPQAPLVPPVPDAQPNPHLVGPPGRPLELAARTGLQFDTAALNARPGERLTLTFHNPDVVPHNFALLRQGALRRVGEQINRLIAEPGAAARHYLPEGGDVLAFTDMVNPGGRFTIHFTAPAARGDYPFLCSFPGHWQVMNGILRVE